MTSATLVVRFGGAQLDAVSTVPARNVYETQFPDVRRDLLDTSLVFERIRQRIVRVKQCPFLLHGR